MASVVKRVPLFDQPVEVDNHLESVLDGLGLDKVSEVVRLSVDTAGLSNEVSLAVVVAVVDDTVLEPVVLSEVLEESTPTHALVPVSKVAKRFKWLSLDSEL